MILPSSWSVVTCRTLLSMILLLRSSRSFSSSFIFLSISSSSLSTSVILTASASPSFTRPRWRLSTWWMQTLIIILFPEHKVYKWCRSHLTASYPLSYAHLSCTIMGIYHQPSGRSLCAAVLHFLGSYLQNAGDFSLFEQGQHPRGILI